MSVELDTLMLEVQLSKLPDRYNQPVIVVESFDHISKYIYCTY